MPIRTAPDLQFNDPMLTRTALGYEVVRYPYGFPARIRSNSQVIMEAADVSWGACRQRFDVAPVEIRLLVSDSESPGCREAPFFRSQGHLISIAGDSENFAVLDLRSGFSFGWVTKNTAENTGYLRQCFLDVMVYPLLETRYMATVHAACVNLNGKGVLLAGDSGAGKSSLAYACARRGWTYVSDDTSAFVRAAPRPLVIGQPQKFRFRETAGELFPEFRGRTATVRTYGRPGIEVRTNTLEGLRTADQSTIDYMVFLNRPGYEGGAAELLALSPEAAWQQLRKSLWEVQVPEFEERHEALRRLLAVPAWELRYADLDDAIALLHHLVAGNVNGHH
ncbi:MAG TPA: hypothetical protein VFA04_02660 [Bryobacteraceae bacterium]|nr:hypothetical protein [Bryobacteraceae bacterium]